MLCSVSFVFPSTYTHSCLCILYWLKSDIWFLHEPFDKGLSDQQRKCCLKSQFHCRTGSRSLMRCLKERQLIYQQERCAPWSCHDSPVGYRILYFSRHFWLDFVWECLCAYFNTKITHVFGEHTEKNYNSTSCGKATPKTSYHINKLENVYICYWWNFINAFCQSSTAFRQQQWWWWKWHLSYKDLFQNVSCRKRSFKSLHGSDCTLMLQKKDW